ncbi:MAG: aminoglycoside adenylyltransferase domain-containing protein [Bacillota bacterium]
MDSRDVLLGKRFRDPQLNLTLEVFLRMLRDILGARLVSVILFGAVVFEDLAPGYGDLDFVAVVDGDLEPELSRRLVEARRPLRDGTFGLMAQMLEGAFLPLSMLDPEVNGRALWWGTSGERPWEHNGLGYLVHLVIRERGLVIWGRDVRAEVTAPTRAQLVGEVVAACGGLRRQASIKGLHAVDALLTAARLLLWLREGRLSSKSEAADWAFDNAQGAWRVLLPQAKSLRLNPGMADSPSVRRWLEALAVPINEACDELEREAAGAVMQ